MSSTETDSTNESIHFRRRHLHSNRSRLYTNPRLPTYQTFLDRLQNLDISTLTPGSYCTICRIPFFESQAEFSNARPDHQHSLLLEALPFNYDTLHTSFDRPVRLPCTSRHIVGRACIMKWAREGAGTTCPLDREELFTFGPEEFPTNFDDEDRFISGARAISDMSIRHLLQRFRNATDSDYVTVNARSMTARLATLLFRVVLHCQGVGEQATARWKWPKIRRPLYNREAFHFRRLVEDFVEAEPLPHSGRYPPHIVTLLNPALPHVFALLYRLARFFQARTVALPDLAYAMQERIDEFLADYSYIVTAEKTLGAIAFKTIDLWTTQELLLTALRSATNQLNEWDDTAGPSHTHLPAPASPYFSIRGAGGMLGYLPDPRYPGRDTQACTTIPVTLSDAAEIKHFDAAPRDLPLSPPQPASRASSAPTSPRGRRGAYRSRSPLRHRGSQASRRMRSGTRTPPSPGLSSHPSVSRWSLRSSGSRASRSGGSTSTGVSAAVRPWSPLGDDEGPRPRAGFIIARSRRRMSRRRRSRDAEWESGSGGSL